MNDSGYNTFTRPSNSQLGCSVVEPMQEESPLQRDMRCITEAIGRLDHELTHLREKLSPVVLAEMPVPDSKTNTAVPVPSRSTYGYNLRDHERQIHAMADAVNSLRNRLEV
jgi:hypothetical protein